MSREGAVGRAVALRQVALRAWAEIEGGRPNPLAEWLAEDERLRVYLAPEDIRVALEARDYVGDAPERALALARRIRHSEWGMAKGER